MDWKKIKNPEKYQGKNVLFTIKGKKVEVLSADKNLEKAIKEAEKKTKDWRLHYFAVNHKNK